MSCKLFVSRVAPQVTTDDLRRLFAGIGPVYRVSLVHDPITRQPRGCAYVEMATEAAAAACARDLDGHVLGGLSLSVRPHTGTGRPGSGEPADRAGSAFVYDRRRKALAEAEALFAKPAP